MRTYGTPPQYRKAYTTRLPTKIAHGTASSPAGPPRPLGPEVPELAGAFVAAPTPDLAFRRAKALALETLADLAELGDIDIADAIHFVPSSRPARVDGPTARAALALEHRPRPRG